jgi:hypothetical protein
MQQALHGRGGVNSPMHSPLWEAGGAKVISVNIGVGFVITSCRFLSQSNPLDLKAVKF